MAARTTKTTEGKQVSFFYMGEYYSPELNNLQKVFDGRKDIPACVLYTTIKKDFEEVEFFGYMKLVFKGLIGYQNFNFFNTLKDANEDYKGRSRLSPKIGIEGYADVMLVINDNYTEKNHG